MRALLRRIHGRLADPSGHTLIELLTVMVILSTILGSLTALFTTGLKTQVELDRRFQAQQAARLALDKIRKEVHCASSATPSSSAVASITLTVPAACNSAGSTTISWCAVTIATGRYGLYRKVGSSCSSSGAIKYADFLTLGTPFTYTPQSPTSLAKLHVDFKVNPKTSLPEKSYELIDDLVLRNSTRA